MKKSDVKKAAGLWNELKESSLEYERKIRSGWSKRFKYKGTLKGSYGDQITDDNGKCV